MSVVIETTVGDITVDLFLKERPRACLNFLKLCKIKYYNYNLFHTVSRRFIAQTGDPTGSRSGGESIFGVIDGPLKRFFVAETNPRIKHSVKGLLSFVGNEENMIGSQFFFTLEDGLEYLDDKHCIFGEVSEGLDVLDVINETICDSDDRPYQDVRITHTVVLDDPLPDLERMIVPSRSPSPSAERMQGGRIPADEDIDDIAGKTAEEINEMIAEREAKARATILEMVGDLPDADMAPPENVLFVCKLNPVTGDDDLEIIFSRFGKIKSCEVIRDRKTGDSLQYAFIEFEEKKSCEDAYFKMDNVLIDDRRIHVDFSQSVSKVKWMGKGRGVKHFNENIPNSNSRKTNQKYEKHAREKDFRRNENFGKYNSRNRSSSDYESKNNSIYRKNDKRRKRTRSSSSDSQENNKKRSNRSPHYDYDHKRKSNSSKQNDKEKRRRNRSPSSDYDYKKRRNSSKQEHYKRRSRSRSSSGSRKKIIEKTNKYSSKYEENQRYKSSSTRETLDKNNEKRTSSSPEYKEKVNKKKIRSPSSDYNKSESKHKKTRTRRSRSSSSEYEDIDDKKSSIKPRKKQSRSPSYTSNKRKDKRGRSRSPKNRKIKRTDSASSEEIEEKCRGKRKSRSSTPKNKKMRRESSSSEERKKVSKEDKRTRSPSYISSKTKGRKSRSRTPKSKKMKKRSESSSSEENKRVDKRNRQRSSSSEYKKNKKKLRSRSQTPRDKKKSGKNIKKGR